MKVHAVSDLHCDNWEILGHALAVPRLKVVGDILVINGDTSDGQLERYLETLTANYLEKGLPVLYVAGNHDHYYRHLDTSKAELERVCKNLGVINLDNTSFVREGVRFYGATTWTNFDLNNAKPMLQMNMAKVLVADYKYIKGLCPEATQLLHQQTVEMLLNESRIAKEKSEKLVFVSHHAPLHECIPEKFASNPVSGAYASDMAQALTEAGVAWAIYGHLHGNVKRPSSKVAGLQLYTNARGCLRGDSLDWAIPENPGFDYEGTFTV